MTGAQQHCAIVPKQYSIKDNRAQKGLNQSLFFLLHCIRGRIQPEVEGGADCREGARGKKKQCYPDSPVPLWLKTHILHNNGTSGDHGAEVSVLPRNMFLPVCSKVSCFKQIVPSLMQRLLQNPQIKPVDYYNGETTKLFRPIKVFERGLASDVAHSRKDADVLIIGGGAMGSSAAYFIKSKSPNTNVIVVERDPKVKD